MHAVITNRRTGCWVRERSRQWLCDDDNNVSLCDNYDIKIMTAITTTTTSKCRRLQCLWWYDGGGKVVDYDDNDNGDDDDNVAAKTTRRQRSDDVRCRLYDNDNSFCDNYGVKVVIAITTTAMSTTEWRGRQCLWCYDCNSAMSTVWHRRPL